MKKVNTINSGRLKEIDAVKKEAASAAKIKVLRNNEDYAPMDFVIDVLMRFFNLDGEKAQQVMFTVHYHGRAVCGIYTAEIAETKVMQVSRYAKEHQHPLMCTMEQV